MFLANYVPKCQVNLGLYGPIFCIIDEDELVARLTSKVEQLEREKKLVSRNNRMLIHKKRQRQCVHTALYGQ